MAVAVHTQKQTWPLEIQNNRAFPWVSDFVGSDCNDKSHPRGRKKRLMQPMCAKCAVYFGNSSCPSHCQRSLPDSSCQRLAKPSRRNGDMCPRFHHLPHMYYILHLQASGQSQRAACHLCTNGRNVPSVAHTKCNRVILSPSHGLVLPG